MERDECSIFADICPPAQRIKVRLPPYARRRLRVQFDALFVLNTAMERVTVLAVRIILLLDLGSNPVYL
jgi:hypothetical protein